MLQIGIPELHSIDDLSYVRDALLLGVTEKKPQNISIQSSRKQGKMPGAQALVDTYMDLQRAIGSRNPMCVS